MASNYFPFVQFELTQSLGPPQGRYMVKDDRRAPDVLDELGMGGATVNGGGEGELETPGLGAGDVLVIRVRGAQVSTIKLRKPKTKKASIDDEPKEVSVSVATVIFGTKMLDGARHGEAFMRAIQASMSEREALVEHGLRVVNRAVSAYRACAADPYLLEVTRADPRLVRIGHGTAEEVVASAWTEAVVVPPPPAPRVTRTVRLMPHQAVAATLAGRAHTMEGEELLLRALVDLEHGRKRGAAYGLAAAWDLLQAELAAEAADAKVRVQQEKAAEAARSLPELSAAARRGPLNDDQVAELERIAEEIGITVDMWRYEPLGFA